MRDKPNLTFDDVQLLLPLPLSARPGIHRPVQCPRCQQVHVNAVEIQRCRQQATWREQA